jgi:acyl transferase domain-containing protein/NADPH:quinone reductase-like Zn-dependent oxidoreductase
MTQSPAHYERLIKQAVRRIQELEAALAARPAAVTMEPIAVVGLACRFPGADDPDALWNLLLEGVDATSAPPPDRWGNATNSWRGGYLADLKGFDPLFFGLSAREAQSLDPQQRLLLEVSWEALERAGIAASDLQGFQGGVFAGLMSGDYGHRLLQRDPAEMDAYQATGTSASVAAGRIAYTLGLQGPTLTVDTACSSSLVAVHLAMQSLRRGDCALALAGGANALLSPSVYETYARTTALSPDGRCKTFSAHADGFGRGEGCGVVVLRRLGDARAANERILAVLRGSAINHDGRASGLTVPNGPAQQAVIQAALKDAGVQAGEVGFVEAHGTGTSLGDPIEMGAIAAVYGPGRTEPLPVGAIKTNFGHLEGSAGIAALIKAILCVERGEIPPNLHFDPPNPHIAWEDLTVRVPTRREPWLGPRLAGVSSFGISGTNAHVLVGEAPDAQNPAETTEHQSGQQRPPGGLHLLPLSARSASALDTLAARMGEHLSRHPDLPPERVCATAATGRVHFEHRLVVMGRNSEELRARLDQAASASASASQSDCFVRDQASRRQGLNVAFLFTGQGSQYPGMGAALYAAYPVYRAAVDRCATLFAPEIGASLIDLLAPDASEELLGQTAITQPALFTVQYALAQLWMSWGIQPHALMGHSAGEVVAACLAGVFDLEDAVRLVACRGRLLGSLPPGGQMAAVFSSDAEVAQVLARLSLPGPVVIAALNGPANTVISGPANAVTLALDAFTAQGIGSRELAISIAAHSPLTESILPELGRVVASLNGRPPQRRLITNLTGSLAGPEIAGPDHWMGHTRSPVRFVEGLRALAAQEIGAYLEIGPRSTLLGMARPCLGPAADEALWLPSLHPDRPDGTVILESLARLQARGATLDWRSIQGGRQQPVVLPTYPFEREPHWIDVVEGGAPSATAGAVIHPLVGRRVQSLALPNGARLFEGTPGRGASASLREHQVTRRPLMPATGYLEMALVASSTVLSGPLVAEDLSFERGLDLTAGQPVQTLLEPHPKGVRVTIASLDPSALEGGWQVHATGRIAPDDAPPVSGMVLASADDLVAGRARCTTRADVDALYGELERLGILYGPVFRGLLEVWRSAGEAIARVALPEAAGENASAYHWHPALLDAVLQVSFAADDDRERAPRLPASLARCAIPARAPAGFLWIHGRIRRAGRDRIADFTLHNQDGVRIGSLEGLYLREAEAGTWKQWLVEPLWQPRPLLGGTLLAPSTLNLSGRAPHLFDPAGLRDYGRAFSELEAVSVEWVARALEELGLSLAPGTRWPTEDLASAVGIAARHRRLFKRLLAIAAEAGLVREEADAFAPLAAATTTGDDPGARLERLRPELPAEVELLSRCGPRLAPVLRGEEDPLRWLFPDGDLSLTTALYERSPHNVRMNALVAQTVTGLCEGLPPGRVLRVLEVGAGSGATTRSLRSLIEAGRLCYHFTDVSPLFLDRARSSFADLAGITYGLFDLERDPAGQDLPDPGYDLIIGANCVHATRRLPEALAHLHTLIVPGGMLLLVEATAPQRWADLTFGLLEGWWRFDDAIRQDYPLLEPAAWRKALQAAGFEETVAHVIAADTPERSPIGAITASQCLLLARSPLPPAGPLWSIIGAAHLADDLAEELRRRGAPAQRMSWPTDQPLPIDGAGLVLIADSDDGPESSGDEIARAARRHVDTLLALARQLGPCPDPPPVWLVTRGAQCVEEAPREAWTHPTQALLWGAARTVREEIRGLRMSCIDLDPQGDAAAMVGGLCDELLTGDGENEIAHRHGERLVARLVRGPRPRPDRLVVPDADNVGLEIRERGSLDQLVIAPAPLEAPQAGEVQLRVRATGLNFRDVLNALGEYPGDPGPLGNECSGEVLAVGPGVADFAPGDRVCALAHGSFMRVLTIDQRLVAPIGELGMVEAATLPIAFLTAGYALLHLARLQPGERVLIHAGSGGVGQAAIQIALRAGAKVYATASRDKWHLLRSLGVSWIYDSRSLDFAEAIRRDTGGAGIDVVLNSLTGPGFVESSLGLVRAGGRFVEISKRGALAAEEVSARRDDLAYWALDLGEVRHAAPAQLGALLRRLIHDVAAGHLRPLPRSVYSLSDAPRAFRTMQQGLHTGKIVLTPPPCTALRADGSYLITGGLGGLGLAVACWLAERGAEHLVLIGRSAPGPEAERQLAALAARGVEVRVERLDISDEAALAAAITRLPSPLRGVVHAAGMLDDGLLTQLTPERFSRVLAPKLMGAWALHRATRTCPLDFFVNFSSAAALLGSAGQANHAAANSFLDAFARHRQAEGLPGQSINWGAWTDIGAAADPELAASLARKGLGGINPTDGLAALAFLLAREEPQAGLLPIDWGRFLSRQIDGRCPPFFEALRGASNSEAHVPAPGIPPAEALRQRLATGDDPGAALLDYLEIRVALLLGLRREQLDSRCPLRHMGLDSLMAVELRHHLHRDLEVDVPLPDLLGDMILTELQDRLKESPSLRQTAATGTTSATAGGWEEMEL